MTRIVTHFDPKPIPVRDSDWQATFEGYDEGDPVGYGPTKQEAIDDLREQEAYAQGRADERETWAPVLEALKACRDYLSCIPESAAGGDDDAVALTNRASARIEGKQ